MVLNLYHSPDADDLFLFWAITSGKLNKKGIEFSFNAADTEKLNSLASTGEADVIAISAALYPKIADSYLILPNGASIGRGYGPVVVAKESIPVEELDSLRVAVPGLNTTAAAILRIISPNARLIEIPIEPFERVFEVLESGAVDAALLIHEGQISYEHFRCEKIIDIGQWWQARYSAPLPLGLNVLKRSLGDSLVKEISTLFYNSIRYGLANQSEASSMLTALNKERGVPLEESEVHRYLSMYANSDSLSLDEDCRKSLEILFRKTSQYTLKDSDFAFDPAASVKRSHPSTTA